MTRRLAAVCARHPWRTITAWVVALVLAVAAIATMLDFTTEAEVLNNPESEQAYTLLNRLPPGPPEEVVNELIVVRSDQLTANDPRFRAKVARLVEETEQPDRIVLDVPPGGVSPDRHARLITVGLLQDAESDIEEVIDSVERANDDDYRVTITGEWSFDRDQVALSEHDLQTGELQFGLPVAIVVLLLVFGAVVAGLLPILLALLSIAVALGMIAVLSQFADLSIFTINMLSGMGLALGVDYSLFVVSRFREERLHGRERDAAIEAAGATSSRAVLFSGSAFVLAMVGLLLVPDTIFRSLAIGAIFAGIVSVLVALTLLPALLHLLGDRVNALRIPFLGRAAQEGTAHEGRFWTAIVRFVMRRPVVTLVTSVAVLIALTLPVVSMESGFVGIRAMPDRFVSKQGFLALESSFGVGTPDDVQVVVDGNFDEPAVRRATYLLFQDIKRDPELRQVALEDHSKQQLAVIEALPVGDSRDEAAYDSVRRIRDELAPNRFDGVPARVLVTGETAESIDYFALVDHWMPIVFTFVLGLSFILLTVAFRSIVVPLKAILLNLLSVGAAYGLLVLVFQEGVGNELLGFQQVDAIEAWVPLFLFAVLFGLSMDYHVFLLSRIRERYSLTGDNEDAVAHSVASTAQLITGAALIIIAVFTGFALGDLVMFQQMGFGVAVALLIDATIVRSVLLPATMKLLGEWNWYLPGWLSWLPNIPVEGSAGR